MEIFQINEGQFILNLGAFSVNINEEIPKRFIKKYVNSMKPMTILCFDELYKNQSSNIFIGNFRDKYSIQLKVQNIYWNNLEGFHYYDNNGLNIYKFANNIGSNMIDSNWNSWIMKKYKLEEGYIIHSSNFYFSQFKYDCHTGEIIAIKLNDVFWKLMEEGLSKIREKNCDLTIRNRAIYNSYYPGVIVNLLLKENKIGIQKKRGRFDSNIFLERISELAIILKTIDKYEYTNL